MLKGADKRFRIEGGLCRGTRSTVDGNGTLGQRLDEVFDDEILALWGDTLVRDVAND